MSMSKPGEAQFIMAGTEPYHELVLIHYFDNDGSTETTVLTPTRAAIAQRVRLKDLFDNFTKEQIVKDGWATMFTL